MFGEEADTPAPFVAAPASAPALPSISLFGVANAPGHLPTYGVPLHQLFNQEQREDLALLATEDAGAETDEAGDGSPPAHSWRSRAELVAEQEQEETLKKEKGQLVEILGILGEKAEKSELEEGAYKEYADLLMKFHKILGEERQRIVNV